MRFSLRENPIGHSVGFGREAIWLLPYLLRRNYVSFVAVGVGCNGTIRLL